ncbi:MAG TPA: SpvB/TcaC N-terminal domain-containing protein [Ktedonobacteraceae bacterium]|nr:SpvB/TcaC N-terminal domain-containing protein [Ktedonobacteraceae bacterium]
MYKEHVQASGSESPVKLVRGAPRSDATTPTPDITWPIRPDPFSVFRACFEVRTYRRCERILLFHSFPTEVGVGTDCLVRSTNFRYSDDTFLTGEGFK